MGSSFLGSFIKTCSCGDPCLETRAGASGYREVRFVLPRQDEVRSPWQTAERLGWQAKDVPSKRARVDPLDTLCLRAARRLAGERSTCRPSNLAQGLRQGLCLCRRRQPKRRRAAETASSPEAAKPDRAIRRPLALPRGRGQLGNKS